VTTTTRQIRQLILSTAIALVFVAGVQTLAGAAPVRVTGTAGKAAEHASIDFKAIAREEAYGPMPLNEHRMIHHPVPRTSGAAPQNGPVPGASPEETQPLSSGAASAQSPAPLSSFQALADNGTVIPPDTDGAVGPNNLMVAVNSQVVIQDRAGATLGTVSLTGFWSSLGVRRVRSARDIRPVRTTLDLLGGQR